MRNIPLPRICNTPSPMRSVVVDMATSVMHWRRAWKHIYHKRWQGCEGGFSSLALACRPLIRGTQCGFITNFQ